MKFSIGRDDTVFILTGAGISAESGLSTFRDSGGLWDRYRVENVATPEAFQKDPELVWEFYSKRRKELKNVYPNKAHISIADFQKKHPKTYLVTQNVDNLHERAGSTNVIHMHGSLTRIRCTRCNYLEEHLEDIVGIPKCKECGNILRPDVVWFGEIPYFLNQIYELLSKTKLFIGIGTSGQVYPAAAFISIAKNFKAKTVFLNKEKIYNEDIDVFIEGNASITVEKFLSDIEIL
uniref:NAD-dependent protein deacylase n=1 Tax=candidate division WOR-3 bacterium TaxID=2052148 RepID=A0A7C3J6G6_UNCW3